MGTQNVREFLICSLMKRYVSAEVADRNGCFLGGGERGVSIRLFITDSKFVLESAALFVNAKWLMRSNDIYAEMPARAGICKN